MDAVSTLVVLLGQKRLELNWPVYRRRRFYSLFSRGSLVGFGFSAASPRGPSVNVADALFLIFMTLFLVFVGYLSLYNLKGLNGGGVPKIRLNKSNKQIRRCHLY